jgi:molybdate transport system substrate-binding protein
MKRSSLAAVISILGLTLVMSPMTDLKAAELRILAGGSMTGPLNELGPQFERASGHKLVIHFDSTRSPTSARPMH